MEQMREARLSEAIALQIAELILSGEIKAKQTASGRTGRNITGIPDSGAGGITAFRDAGAGEAACYPAIL